MKQEIVRILKKVMEYLAARDLAVLLVFLVLIAGIWAFIEIADEFREGESYRFDRAVLLMMRTAEDPSVPRGPAWLFPVMRDVTALGSGTIVLLVTLVATGFMLLVKRFYDAVLTAVITGGGAGIGYILKLLFARERPFEVPPLIEATLYSFPSGHALMAALVYLPLGAMLAGVQPQIKIRVYILCVALAVVFMVGVSRIYLGVHYPTDVLAGWSMGLAWASFSRLAVRAIEKHGFRI